MGDSLKNLFQAERSIKHFILFLAFAVAAAVFVVSKGQESVADIEALDNSQNFILRRQLLRGGMGENIDMSAWKAYLNAGRQSLALPRYELRYPGSFALAESNEYSSFSSRSGHCKLLVGVLGREIDFTVKNQTNETVNPFSIAVLELGDQWSDLKKFRYYLFSDTLRRISIEGEADTPGCLDILRGMISTFKFIK
ncbi:MAG: hypothetical protein HYT98_05425 [Candidatus Sungbacteria bacterium]|nr:hypothetical protein [Candidatus Sungbacteria bacterium]